RRSILDSVTSSVKTLASALDPRLPMSTPSSLSFPGQDTKPGSSSTAAATRTLQHTRNAIETLASGSTQEQQQQQHQQASMSWAGNVGSGFRTATTPSSNHDPSAVHMDWDNFLASSESDLPETMEDTRSRTAFNSFASPSSSIRTGTMNQRINHPWGNPDDEASAFVERQLQGLQLQSQEQAPSPTVYSPPTNFHLTPANHGAFLDYLRSTATATPMTANPVITPLSPPQIPSQQQQVWPSSLGPSTATFSSEIHRQQHLDGLDVVAFLESTSYSEYVEELESASMQLDRHQTVRKEYRYQFCYTDEWMRGRPAGLRLTMQLIQDLPSERQDIVQYLMQKTQQLPQGSYAEDVYSHPFGHDQDQVEAASLEATRQEQEQFLAEQRRRAAGSGEEDGEEDATTREMERVLKEIVEEAKEEVKGGETDGRALNRLMMVRKHMARL
ncbi:hypothetical protein BGW38_006095, partial [Lunasporangiospora selenospora]